MKRILIFLLIAIFFAFCGVAFLSLVIYDGDVAMIAPSILFMLISAVLIAVGIREWCVRADRYIFEDGGLKKMRRGETVAIMRKEDVERLVIVKDIFGDKNDIHLISFRHGGRKYIVAVNDRNKEEINKFITGAPHTERGNLWYYLLELISW